MLLLGRCPWYTAGPTVGGYPLTSSSSQDTRMGSCSSEYLNSKGGAP